MMLIDLMTVLRFPDPPAAPRLVVNCILALFRLMHRHLSLPRLRPSELTPRELPKHQRGKDILRMRPTEYGHSSLLLSSTDL